MATSPCQAVTPGLDALAQILSAIKALPATGGCVDARGLTGTQTGATTVLVDRPVTLLLGAVQIQSSANPTFRIQATSNPPTTPISGLTVLGNDPNSSVIVAAQTNVTLFQLAGDIVPISDYVGGETLTIKRCGLCGGNLGGNGGLAGTVMVNAPGYPATNFQQGLLLIEDNLITNFGDTALKIGASVYFNRIHRNEFLCNHQAIFLDNNTETSITENHFIMGPAPNGPTLTSIGPMHRIVHNYFYRNSLPDARHSTRYPPATRGWVGKPSRRLRLDRGQPLRKRTRKSGSDQEPYQALRVRSNAHRRARHRPGQSILRACDRRIHRRVGDYGDHDAGPENRLHHAGTRRWGSGSQSTMHPTMYSTAPS